MKKLYFLFLLIITFQSPNAQTPFLFSVESNAVDKIFDAVQIADKFYLLRGSAINNTSDGFDGYTDLFITSEDGTILDEISLNGFRTVYERIIKVEGNEIFLVGYIKTDSCLSSLIVSKYNIESQNLTHLSSLDFCDHLLSKIRVYKSLKNETFIDETHTYSTGYTHQIYKLEPDYHLTLMADSISVTNAFSEDFSRNGFLFSFSSFYYFYDQNFNFIKQVYKPQLISYINETTLPFGRNLILQQSVQDKLPLEEDGIHVRLIDSNINIIKKVIFFPPGTRKIIRLPYFNGMAIKNSNEIWTTGFYEPLQGDLEGFYTIAKLDSNLNIVCQHFLGYDTYYWLFGIRALESGAIVYGGRVKNGHHVNEGDDAFAIRIGENCELPAIVATDDPKDPILSISAYPNPGIDDLTFEVSGFDPASLRIEMIEPSGKILFSTTDLTSSIRVPQLPAGQYFYRILQKDKLLGVGSWVKE